MVHLSGKQMKWDVWILMSALRYVELLWAVLT